MAVPHPARPGPEPGAEVDLHSDLPDLARLSPAERHLMSRLVAFFATGDTIVANNLVLNLYQYAGSAPGPDPRS